jgi:hypothetical protein
MRVGIAALVLLFSSACEPAMSPSAAAPSVPVAVFPPKDDLAVLPSLPAPEEAFGVESVAVESWASRADPASQDEPGGYEDPSPWGALARELVAAHAHGLRLSPALRCAATEVAQFRIDKGGLPNESLRRFVAARCGVTSPDATPIVYTLDAPAAVTDQAIYEHMGPPVRDLVEKHLSEGPHGIGIATARKGRHVAVAAVLAADGVRFDGLSRTVDPSRRAILRGRILAPAAQAVGIINRGDYGTATCQADPSLKLPEFAFTCELGAGDASAWVEILARGEGRTMATSVADVLVCDGDPARLEYHPRNMGPASPVVDGAGLSVALLEGINRVRKDAHFQALTLERGQSGENTRLTGTLIDATVKNRAKEADVIALGLVAGWNVDGMIRSGNLFMGLVAPTLDATALLGFAVERPFGRTVLLDPDARRIAIGAVVPPGGVQALGAVITTYSLFESPHHAVDEARVIERMTAARAARGKPPLSNIEAPPAMAEQVAMVLSGDEEPMAAVQRGMQSLALRSSGTVRGYVSEANELGLAPIPDEILRMPRGKVAVIVTHHKVKGAAWGQYVVFFLVVGEGETEML